MKIKEASGHRAEIIALLATEKLPTKDLPFELDHFLVAEENGTIVGVAGLEIYENNGLLRSVAVDVAFRNKNIAGELLMKIEDLAVSKGLQAIYLLTETAPDYFIKKDYLKTERSEVPSAMQQSSEFSFVCPQSAILLKKEI